VANHPPEIQDPPLSTFIFPLDYWRLNKTLIRLHVSGVNANVILVIDLWFSSSLGMAFFFRLSFAGARNGDLPTVLALINIKFLTPITSLVLQVSHRVSHHDIVSHHDVTHVVKVSLTVH